MGNYLYSGVKNDIKCSITDKNSNKCSTICTGIKNLNCMEYNYYIPTNKSIIRRDFIIHFIKNNEIIDTFYINIDESKSMRVVVDSNILYENSYESYNKKDYTVIIRRNGSGYLQQIVYKRLINFCNT